MKFQILNLRMARKTAWILGLVVLLGGCSTPRIFQFQDIQFFVSSSSQAQLGNVGLMTSEDGFGFQRMAFLSDCQNHSLPVSIDATIHGILPLQNAFGSGVRAKQLSIILGVPKESLEQSSVLLLAINPLDAQQSAADWPQSCKTLVGRAPEQTRMIVAVAALVPHQVLNPSLTHQVTAKISQRGHIGLTIHQKKKREINVGPQAIFAWRSGHFCWDNDSESSPILRSDDPGFEPCPEGYQDTPPIGSAWYSGSQENPEPVDDGSETSPSEEPAADPTPETPETGTDTDTTPSI